MSLRNQQDVQNAAARLGRGINMGLLAFGGIFFSVGLLVTFALAGPMVFTGIASQQWLPVEAELLEAGLHSSRGKSTTWQAWGRYRYQVNGQVYENDRVALMTGSDNMGDFQQRLGRELESALAEKRPVTIWYDPQDPANSVLNKEIRWGMLGFVSIFLVVFGGIGLATMLFGLRGVGRNPLGKAVAAQALRAMKNRAAAGSQAPMPASTATQGPVVTHSVVRIRTTGSGAGGQGKGSTSAVKAGPWLANPAWRGGRIESSAAQKLRVYWYLGGLMLFVALIFQFFGQEFWPTKDDFDLVVRVLMLILGLTVLGTGLRARSLLNRYGLGHLSLDPFPGAIGGELGGIIELDVPFDSGMRAELTLRCLEWAAEGRVRGEAPIWESRGCAKVLPTAKGSRLGFRFLIPEALPQSSLERKGTFYIWRLELRLRASKVTLERDFELPVFATGAKSAHLQPLARDVCPELAAASEVAGFLPLERGAGLQRLYYPMGRKPFRAIAFLGMGLGFLFVGVAQTGWTVESANDLPLLLIFGTIGLVTLLIGCYLLLNSLEVRLDGLRLWSCRRILGIPVRCRQLPYAQLGQVEVRQGMTTSRGGRRREVEYRVSVSSQQGRLALAENIYIRHQAEEARKFFESEFRKARGYQR